MVKGMGMGIDTWAWAREWAWEWAREWKWGEGTFGIVSFGGGRAPLALQVREGEGTFDIVSEGGEREPLTL